MVEEVCNILNNGEVPNLFPAEEKAKILEDLGTSVVVYIFSI
jgi:dynein heavy chain